MDEIIKGQCIARVQKGTYIKPEMTIQFINQISEPSKLKGKPGEIYKWKWEEVFSGCNCVEWCWGVDSEVVCKLTTWFGKTKIVLCLQRAFQWNSCDRKQITVDRRVNDWWKSSGSEVETCFAVKENGTVLNSHWQEGME